MHNFSNTTKYIDNSLINSQSLEDTQVGYILQKYTFDIYTLEKYNLKIHFGIMNKKVQECK